MNVFKFRGKFLMNCLLICMAIILAAVCSWGEEENETNFEEFSIDDCVAFAVKNSFEARLAKLDLYIAETDLMYSEAVFDTFLSGGAEYSEDKRQQLSVFSPDDHQTNKYYGSISKTLPTGTELTAELAETREWSNSLFNSKNPSHEVELTFGAEQPVGRNIFGYIDRKNISLTKLAIKNSGVEMEDRIESLMTSVEKAFWGFVEEKELLDVSRKMTAKAEELYETGKRNFDIGLMEKSDLLAAEANVENRKAELISSENSFRRAEEELKLIMNMDGDKRVLAAGELKADPIGRELPDCLSEAFVKRRDYDIKKREVEKKDITVKIKENMKWPEIDLSVTMAMNGLEKEFDRAAGKSVIADNVYYFAGVEFSLPIENKEARSAYLKAVSEKEKVLVELKETERSIITEVGNAFRDAKTAETGLIYLGRVVELSAEKLTEEEKRFKAGRSSTKQLIDYQEDLIRAGKEHVRALFNCRISRVDLERSINAVFEKYEGLL